MSDDQSNVDKDSLSCNDCLVFDSKYINQIESRMIDLTNGSQMIHD